MQIEAGKYYETRDGRIVGPAIRNVRREFSHQDWVLSGLHYNHDGTWSLLRDPADLIREHIPTPARRSLIFGAAMVGSEPVPVPEKVERVLWEGVAGECQVYRDQHMQWLMPIGQSETRIRIVEISE